MTDVREAGPPHPEALPAAQRDRRARIVDKMFAALLERNYDTVQVRDIAEAADVALGTLYRYFASKEHLAAAALVRWGEALQTRVTGPNVGGDIASSLAQVYNGALDAFGRHPQIYGAFVAIEMTSDPYARALWEEFSTVTMDSLDAPLAELDRARATAISQTLGLVLHGALRSWSNGSLTMAEAHRRIGQAIDLIFAESPPVGIGEVR